MEYAKSEFRRFLLPNRLLIHRVLKWVDQRIRSTPDILTMILGLRTVCPTHTNHMDRMGVVETGELALAYTPWESTNIPHNWSQDGKNHHKEKNNLQLQVKFLK